jgi:hypothetical protein
MSAHIVSEGEGKMAYDEEKDKELAHWEKDGLHVSVQKYGDGKPKVQIGPREVKGKFSKAGRLSIEEFEWITSLLKEIEEIISVH